MHANEHDAAIADLDLAPIKLKLMHRASGEGWTLGKANAVEREYRRFLTLMKMFPAEPTAPLVDVDIFWHYHILDTMKYAADCAVVFGYFLHHFPYVGMRGEADEQARQAHGVRMKQLYEQTFGEPYLPDVAGAPTNAYCGAAGTVAYCGATANAAYCGATAKAAYCGAAATPAYCGANANAAYCGATATTAYCGAATAAAYCGAATAAAYCGAATTAAYCGASALSAPTDQHARNASGNAHVYAERPRLDGAS